MKEINWKKVNRVLVVRMRSIGDTVLATPSIIALRRFLPDSQIDILLEDWVASILDGFDAVDNVLTVGIGLNGRMKTVRQIRQNNYDVVFNLHGGTTATFFTYASGARDRVGYSHYQYSFLYNHLLSSSADFWKAEDTHSAEQQLALLGSVGVPVEDRPKSRLVVTESAKLSIENRLSSLIPSSPPYEGGEAAAAADGVVLSPPFILHQSSFALFHPAAAFATKTWAAENFARTAEFLDARGLRTIAVAAGTERVILEKLQAESRVPITIFDDLTLPEITALASKAVLFVGNDSGIAHMAAAVNTPCVVVFGSSNVDHWRPWTAAPNEIVFEKLPCQPCPGYVCAVFGDPKCTLSIRPESVFEAIEKVLTEKLKTEK